MSGPISPESVGSAKGSAIPAPVFEAFNSLIAISADNGFAKVTQEDVVLEIQKLMNCSRQHVFEKGWLNVEDAYREAGWLVEYDKPGYCESYAAYFVFRAKGGDQ